MRCVTILKAWFDENAPITNPVVASDDGLSLVPYTGGDAGRLTVGGELNKVASNIAIARNMVVSTGGAITSTPFA